jgi:dipeptide transport system ATP-binding protein
VMYAGQAMENRLAGTALRAPAHPYTSALLAALPERAAARAKLPTIPGVVPGIADRPAGCVFQPRCFQAQPRCIESVPMFDLPEGEARCFFPLA